MARNIPSFPDPSDKSTPITNAYAVRTLLNVNIEGSNGQLAYLVYRSKAAYDAGSAPVGTIPIPFGESFGNGHAMPHVKDFLSDASLQAALASLFSWLDGNAANHPALVGSTEVA